MRYLFIVYLVLFQLLCACQKGEVSKGGNYTFVQGDDLAYRKVYYEAVDGYAITEGDIVLGTLEEAEASRADVERKSIRKRAIGIKSLRSYWPEGEVPYAFDSSLENGKRAIDAMAHINKNSMVRFIERTNQTDYIVFSQKSSGCFSYVGKRGGAQVINIASGCDTGATVHEILHALGFWHEQSRKDRDDYIAIQWENIDEKNKHNFEQHLLNGVDMGEYDYASIMHYSAYAFSKNGKPTILKTDGTTSGIGNRSGMSEKDMVALLEMYPG